MKFLKNNLLYWVSLAAAFVMCALLALVIGMRVYMSIYVSLYPDSIPPFGGGVAAGGDFYNSALAVIAIITPLASIIALCFGVIFGWRSDRRQAKEADLRIQEMSLKIQQLEKQLDS